MFNLKLKELKEEYNNLDKRFSELLNRCLAQDERERELEFKIKELKKDHELELREKDFKLKHFKDDEIKELRDKIVELEKENAVLKTQKESLEAITDYGQRKSN